MFRKSRDQVQNAELSTRGALDARGEVKTKYGRRTFDFVGPRLWNTLPLDVRTEKQLDIFKNRVNAILFDLNRGAQI